MLFRPFLPCPGLAWPGLVWSGLVWVFFKHKPTFDPHHPRLYLNPRSPTRRSFAPLRAQPRARPLPPSKLRTYIFSLLCI